MGKTEFSAALELFKKFEGFPRFTPAILEFLDYTIETPDVLSVLYQLKSIFGQDGYAFDPGCEDPVIFDCGANVGVSTLYFARRFPKATIIAFEADPNIFSYFARNLRQHCLDGIQARPEAVWTHDGNVAFALEGADGGCINGPYRTVKVPCVRLRDLLRERERVDFIKMDIEGSETDVLLDCKDHLPKVDRIFLEYHSWTGKPQTLDIILNLLTQAGFRYYMETICNRGTPFLNPFPAQEKDYQSEIFAWKQVVGRAGDCRCAG